MSETTGTGTAAISPSPKSGTSQFVPPCDIDRLAIIVVTFKRQHLLKTLFDSYLKLTRAPWRIIIVDNENSPETAKMVAELGRTTDELWGIDDERPDSEGGHARVVYAPQQENLGGAGGFSAGVTRAFMLGAQWFWVMDDDVMALPDALEKLAPWTRDHQVIQGSRLDYDGGPFYWQYHFMVSLGIPNPIAPAAFDESGFRVMNTLCFEGGLFSREIVRKIGFPDPRFFIYWDDTVYGYLASKVSEPIVVADLIIQRTRDIANWNIAGLRQLNGTSDMTRYHIMRNRGLMMQYFRARGDYNRFVFGIGTAATFAKELIRLIAVDRSFKTGLPALVRGMHDARKIYRDRNWKPMPALTDDGSPITEEQPARP